MLTVQNYTHTARNLGPKVNRKALAPHYVGRVAIANAHLSAEPMALNVTTGVFEPPASEVCEEYTCRIDYPAHLTARYVFHLTIIWK